MKDALVRLESKTAQAKENATAAGRGRQPRTISVPTINVWFEPWRYEREPDLIIPLLTELTTHAAEALNRKDIKHAVVQTGLKLVGRVAKAAARTATDFVAKQVGVSGEDIELPSSAANAPAISLMCRRMNQYATVTHRD